MNETGIKILNMKAGTLYGYNLGIRDRYDYTTGVFNHSLFRIFLQKKRNESNERPKYKGYHLP